MNIKNILVCCIICCMFSITGAHAYVGSLGKDSYQYANVCSFDPAKASCEAKPNGAASFYVDCGLKDGSGHRLEGVALCASVDWDDAGYRYGHNPSDPVFCACKIIAPFVGPGLWEPSFTKFVYVEDCEKDCANICADSVTNDPDFLNKLVNNGGLIYNNN